MSDFASPEYASYVALCGELKLERKFQWGDWYWFEGDHIRQPWSKLNLAERQCDYDQMPDDSTIGDHGDARIDDKDDYTVKWTWLPSLADWLEMLEEAGITTMTFVRGQLGYGISIRQPDWQIYVPDIVVLKPTREEAAARLWLAVVKPIQTVPVGDSTNLVIEGNTFLKIEQPPNRPKPTEGREGGG